MRIICHGLKEEDFSVEFTDRKIFIGRDESNGIVVAADGISRFHSVLIEDGDELFIQDNDSLNGTFLNYNQVRGRQKLVQGDIIQIGYRLIKVDFRPDQDVVLDFVPPEETEIVSQDSAKPPLKVASPEPDRTIPGGDDVERTMVASETMLSRSSKPDKSLLPGGSEIGKYVIIKRLGKGGMGEVYLAKHKTLGICRALKLLSKDSGDNDTRFLERFIREAKLASEIRHPNVVGVMDVETDSDCGFPYIVMEYVDGGSLRNSLTASVRLSEEQSVVIVEAIASALQAAEEHNIVHRDIKPDNIMFTRRGEVKLADLGIAKVDGKDTDLTKTNMMIGTPAYLPPEQAQNAKGVDARADIYSLGATFYEMLTGQQPYPGENSIEVLHKLFLTPVPDPRKLNPAVSAASAAIVMKMMAKDPKDRFQNATELLAMLEKTFPPHTAQESAELIRKVIAGECQNNTSFSSNISMSRFSILWSRIPNKRFVIPVAGLVFAICVLCVLFPFLGKKPAAGLLPKMDKTGNAFEETGDVSAQTETYVLQIRTTPDSDIRFISPDGRMVLYSPDDNGSVIISGLNAGKYRVRISRNNYQDFSYEFELKKDLTLDLPLKAASENLPPKEEASAGKPETKTDGAVAPAGGSPLRVTTNKDVIDANDGATSLREALEYVQNGDGNNGTIVFARDFMIRLSSPLAISKSVIIDGGKNDITIIGPETEPMFRISKADLRLKDLTLISDRSGDGAGIMDVTSTIPMSGWLDNYDWRGQIVELVSVKDGGKAENLWKISNIGFKIDGESHIHRLAQTGDASIKICVGSILDDSTLEGGGEVVSGGHPRARGDFLVYGLLKDSTVLNATLWLYTGGSCENLTLGEKGFLVTSDGTVNGLNVGFGGLLGYEPGCVLNGTISISGGATAPNGGLMYPKLEMGTDVVFDLTERTEEKGFSLSRYAGEYDEKSFKIKNGDPILDNIKVFNGARSYTIQVLDDQPVGTYKLAGNAEEFSASMHLQVGNDYAYSVLTVGKHFIKDQKRYSLSIQDNTLALTIRRTSADDRTNAAGSGAAAVRTDPGANGKLQGVLYLLSSRVGGRGSIMSGGGKKTTYFDTLKKFTLGSWFSSTNAKGETYYPELEPNFKRQAAPGLSFFCQDTVSWEKGAELFDCRNAVEDAAGWIAVYSGYVVAPFTGKFRFLGYCDDMMVVRFNRQIVIDYGNRSLTSGLPLLPDHGMVLHSLDTGERVDSGTDTLYNILTNNPATKEEKRMLNESPLYSRNNVSVTPVSPFGSNLIASPELNIQKGQVIPIDILIGELHQDAFNMLLLIERLDSNGKPFDDSLQHFFLFRTTSDKPGKVEDPENKLYLANPDAPIWKVVDSRGNPVPAKRAQK